MPQQQQQQQQQYIGGVEVQFIIILLRPRGGWGKLFEFTQNPMSKPVLERKARILLGARQPCQI
jgi:hypothetical protein